MFCMNCGKKIDDDSKFCPFCGSDVGGTTQSNEQTQRMSMSSQIPSMSAVKAVKKPISKNAVIGVAACLVAVLVVIGVIKLFTGGFGKTFAEQLFQMSWEEVTELFSDKEELNSALDVQGVFDENDRYYYNKPVSSFMGYDCYIEYDYTQLGLDDFDNASFMPELTFGVVCETEKEYKNAKKDILKYLNKNLVKGYDVKTEDIGDDLESYLYLTDISTDCNKIEETAQYEWWTTLYYITEDDCEKMQETLRNCKVYKFTCVFLKGGHDGKLSKMLNYDIEDCPEYGYILKTVYAIMTDEEFEDFMR